MLQYAPYMTDCCTDKRNYVPHCEMLSVVLQFSFPVVFIVQSITICDMLVLGWFIVFVIVSHAKSVWYQILSVQRDNGYIIHPFNKNMIPTICCSTTSFHTCPITFHNNTSRPRFFISINSGNACFLKMCIKFAIRLSNYTGSL